MSEHQKGSRRPPSPIDGYRTTIQASSGGPGDASVDELLTSSEGAFVVREAIEDLGAAELRTRLRVVQRLVRDEGITQGGTAPGRPARPWRLDPLPVVLDAAQWRGIEAAVQQRSRLMDALHQDLYGRRRVLENRLVPAEVVVGHQGFLPVADQVRLPGKRQLLMTAQDLARGSDGSWLLLADRVQAPTGAGYAMANRRVVARAMSSLHRSLDLRRLRGFFDIFQAAVQEAAHPMGEVPSVVLLGSGPADASAYDRAMMSTLLGYPLVQSDDLVMRGGRLWMRTTGQLAAVDVVMRGVDAAWCDSLDLRADSRLGVPGLAAASARGDLGVVNPLGAGVLENPGLIPYLGRVSQSLLGEALLMEQPETWWCGDDTSRQHVLARLDQLVVKPLARVTGSPSVLGWQLDAAGRESLAARISAEPWAWAAQVPVTGSTAPVVTAHGLEPRTMVLRTFASALDGDYHVMPGGLGRVAGSIGEPVLAHGGDVLGKDVWVLDDGEASAAPLEALMRSRARHASTIVREVGLSPRAAGNLYWMGRYAERAEMAARLVAVADNLVEDHMRRPGSAGHEAMRVMLRTTAGMTGVLPTNAPLWQERPLAGLREACLGDRPGTLASSVESMEAAHDEVRELLSLDTTTILGGLQATLTDVLAEGAQVQLQRFSSRVLESSLALSGLAAENLVRDASWAFLDAGRRIERAQATGRLLHHAIARSTSPRGGHGEQLVLEAVLRVGDSVLTHRRRVAAGQGSVDPVAQAVHLLLVDDTNPRSVLAQLERLSADMVHAPSVPVQTEVRELVMLVRGFDSRTLCVDDRTALVSALDQLDGRLRALSDLLERTHFRHQVTPITFEVPDDVLAEEMR